MDVSQAFMDVRIKRREKDRAESYSVTECGLDSSGASGPPRATAIKDESLKMAR